MLRSKNIIVCTDFSGHSDLALKAAHKLHRKLGGQLHLLHVSEFPLQWDWVAPEARAKYLSDEFTQDLMRSLEERMQTQLQRCQVECSSHVVMGVPYGVIHEYIEKLHGGLLVMGHKGMSDNTYHIGGLTVKLISSAPIPSLVIKRSESIAKVAALVDTSEELEDIIRQSEMFTVLFQAKMEVISLWKDVSSLNYDWTPLENTNPVLTFSPKEKNEILNKMRERISSFITHTDSRIKVDITKERQVAYHLVELLHADKVDLAVMKRHQKGMMEKILLGSETRRMLELFEGNLLVLPP